MKGLAVSEHLGRSMAEVYPDWFPLLEPYLRRAMDGESISDVELTTPEADGETAMMISYQPARDEAGDVMGVSIAAVDVTEQKRVERALRESEDHLQHMVDFSPHILWTLDAAGPTDHMSRRWEDLTGLACDGLGENAWLNAVHPDDLARVMAERDHCLLTGELMDSDYRVVAREGGWRWMRSRATPRRDKTGSIVRWYGCLEDIHERKTAELVT